jgi:hypothetical protein
MQFYFLKDNEEFYYDTVEAAFNHSRVKKNDFLRYFKGVYSNKERFMNRYVKDRRNKIESSPRLNTDMFRDHKEYMLELLNFWVDRFDEAKPFTFAEALTIHVRTSFRFRNLIFASISIPELIEQLGSTRIKVAGIPVKQKKFDNDGKMTGWVEFENIYETYKVNGSNMGLSKPIYAVKCWCTSTNKEHWLWIEEAYKDDPLSAIASTFRVHANVIPYIKEIKRHGDVLLLEMTEQVKPTGKIVPLTKEQYFGLLTAQG